MLLDELARTSEAVAAASARTAKVAELAACLRRLRPDDAPIAVAYLSGALPHGPIGVGWAALRGLPPPAAPPPELELAEVDAALRAIGAAAGPGSQAVRRNALAELFGRATEPEQRFLQALLHGELRQGALESIVADAVARAAGVPVRDVRRALMLAGNLGAVATAALSEGGGGLATFRLEVLRPVQPMLAQTAESPAEALERVGEAAVEWKLDGARLQVHRLGQDVRAFTRNIADITDRVPEVVEAVLALPVDAVVLDGEAIALRPDGSPEPFQVTMSRFGSRTVDKRVSLSPFFFDCLHLDGDDLLDLPLVERRAALAARVPEAMRPAAVETGNVEEAARLLEGALALGH